MGSIVTGGLGRGSPLTGGLAGGDAGATPPPTPATLVDAIHDRIARTAPLVARLGDRHYDVATPQPGAVGVPAPYFVLNDLGVPMDQRTTGDVAVRTYQFDAMYVDVNATRCWSFLDLFRAAFNPRMAPLVVPGKTFLSGWVGRAHTLPGFPRGRDGRPRVQMAIPLFVMFSEPR